MNRKERIIRILVCAYPNSWRAEYGEELASILAARPLRLGVVADVAFNALRQRLTYDAPWKICGMMGFLWTVLCIAANSATPLSPVAFSMAPLPWSVLAMVVGFRTVSREPGSLRLATHAALKSAMLGIVPELIVALLWTMGLLHPTLLNSRGVPVIHGAWITVLFIRAEQSMSPVDYLMAVVTIPGIVSLCTGFAGAFVGRVVVAARTAPVK